MQSRSIGACLSFASGRSFLGFHHRSSNSSILSRVSRVSCGGGRRPERGGGNRRGNRGGGGGGEKVKLKVKENVWSVDNKLAEAAAMEEEERRKKSRRRGRVRNLQKRGKNSRVLVSTSMLMETETVLQTQEPVIVPVWNTFFSSVSGIWKGVGAVFSPFTGEMEPIGVGKRGENHYDCYTLVRVGEEPGVSDGARSRIYRKVNWVTHNPHGEMMKQVGKDGKFGDGFDSKGAYRGIDAGSEYGSIDFEASDVLEEDLMGMEPGLVFFEDGSYSRGPLDIPVGEFDKNFPISTFKFEQCLVKGCHKRLRIVHTIEFNEGGSDIQIIRVAVYEEEWISPVNLYDESDVQFNLKSFSHCKRTQPSELTGSWKVFEMSATPIFDEEEMIEEEGRLPYVYLSMETLNKRSLPENPVYFGEEEMLDMQDVTVLWLPGGVTAYVDVNKDGILCIGVGWYSEEGINLVMERDYGTDGKLKEVRWKSEVKRRWSDPLPL
ncbi:hypothetical protein QJS04_geneDACA018379 [Acorus gramineus]|uniref:Uncharacterized protein n=1 Tax=Acorus gramineus TaxID=55184 RepID=A0AAV9ABB1_ACOGR|nr:hypothetical protein QJS04_geneDACA018379 [Acorus gramineus]